MSEAEKQLREHQERLDFDGVMVGVSRQALDEVLTELAELREAAYKYIGDKGHAKWCVGFIEESNCSCGLTKLTVLLEKQ